jgi:hypothetical protein
MEPNWPSTREVRAPAGPQHAQHHLGVHLYRGRPVRADYPILAVLSSHDWGPRARPRGAGNGLGRYSSFVRNSQGCMPIASARFRCSATPDGSVR